MQYQPQKKEVTTEFLREQMALSALEVEMLRQEQVDCPVTHEFADGVYSRKMFAPAGTLVLGKRHRLKTYNILLSGEVTVYAGESMQVKRIKAPATFTSDAMVRKLLFFHQDSEFINIHPTEETDLEKIEDQFIIPEGEFIIDTADQKNIVNERGDLCLG